MTMPREKNSIVFLAGLGAPIELYSDLIETIRTQIPHKKFHVLEWWSQHDFGKNELNRYLQNPNTILIGHSAGGSMSIQALADSPDVVRWVVMLDSHTLKGMSQLPSIEKFLDIILSCDSKEVIDKVRKAYVPLANDSKPFDRALLFLSEWVKNDFPKVCSAIKTMQDHTVLHMGFTDSQYQVLDAEHEKELSIFWGQNNFDTQFLPMTHFELILASRANMIVQEIADWLNRPVKG